MLRIFILLSLTPLIAAFECFNGGIYGGSQFKKCYHFIYAAVTHDDADAICSNIGAKLVSISNAFEQNFIFGHAREHFSVNDYWIGLADPLGQGIYTWNDGSQLGYQNWIPDNRSNDPFDNCVASRLNNGQWYNTDCDTVKKHFVCETTPQAITPTGNGTVCPPSTEKYDPRGKCLLNVPSEQTYSDAELICGSLQGSVTSVADVSEMAFLTAAAKAKFGKQDYWIGLNYFDELHAWQWSDDTEPKYFNWGSGSPADEVIKSCVGVRASRGMWYNEVCESNSKYFVCQLGKMKLPTPGPEDSGWSYFAETNAWYKVTPINLNWDEMEAKCVEMGAHLASIHSCKENQFVLGLASGYGTQDFAIGLISFVADSSTFQWTDHSDMDYTHWLSGYPVKGDFHCGFLEPDGNWANGPCLYVRQGCGVCKRA